MKKATTFLNLFLIAVLVTAQVPDRMSYQSVIRDADGKLVANQEIGMQISILQGAADGTAVYVERHFPETNDNGLVSLEIGGGTEISGIFEEIDWGSDMYFIKTETDLQGGASYTIAGVNQILSVPYALHAKTAETVTEGIEETDPVFGASPAADIEATHIDNWEEAFSWGDHDGLYRTIDWNPAWDDIEDKPDLADLADVATSGSYDDLTDTPELEVDHWNEAYSWGDHALADYLTEESDPLFEASPAADIEVSDIDNWDEAFDWGDHDGLYRTIDWNPAWDEIEDKPDLADLADVAISGSYDDLIDTPELNVADWDAAHSWGNHADAGYISGAEDVVINGLTVGRGGGNILSNTAFGALALRNNTTGEGNTAIGRSALLANVANSRSTAIGFEAMIYADAGTTDGRETFNTAVGYQALRGRTPAIENTGRFNTAIGDRALSINRSGDFNTALGCSALRNNTSGDQNTASGYRALENNSTGERNTAIGVWTLLNSTGNFNTAIGAQALRHLTSGSNNTAVGDYAGAEYTTIEGGTFIGKSARPATNDQTNVTAIGYGARTTDKNMVRIGNSNVTSIGGNAAWTSPSDERYKRNVDNDVAGLDFILKLRPVTYNLEMDALSKHLGENQRRDADGNIVTKVSESDLKAREAKAAIRYTGFVAQEVEATAKAIGYDFSGVDAPQNKEGIYGLRYAEFVVPLVKAVQEQQEMIDVQQHMIDNHQEVIDNKRHRIDRQQEMIQDLQAEMEALRILLDQ